MQFSSNLLMVCVFVSANMLFGADAALKTSFLEDLCFMHTSATIELPYEASGILMSVPRNSVNESFHCEVTLIPQRKNSVALSIYRYDINSEDQLIIEDSDRHIIRLFGSGLFKDEKKSIISNGKIIIRYKKSSTTYFSPKVGFQFTFTHLQEPPCLANEYQCQNKKCISKLLACDNHNHCGDNSDQLVCVPRELKELDNKKTNPDSAYVGKIQSPLWMPTIITATIILGIIIVSIVIAICRAKLKKSSNHEQQVLENNPEGNISLYSNSFNVPPNNVQPDISNEIQRAATNVQHG